MIPGRISLLHATYHREGGVDDVIDAWLGAADQPALVQYILASDEGDPSAEPSPRNRNLVALVRNPPDPQWSTAVRNWNAAAQHAKGEVMMAIADDLFPPQGWDTQLRRIYAAVDPLEVDFAIKVNDSRLPTEVLLRHPIVSRAYYEKFGLMHPLFHGMYVDNELTTRTFWKSVIIDGRSIDFDHRHPNQIDDWQRSDWNVSQERANRVIEYEWGEVAYHGLWRAWRRDVPVTFMPPPTDGQPKAIRAWARATRRRALWSYVRSSIARKFRRADQPSG